MKKIEREPVPDEKEDLYIPDIFCVVKRKDLDAQETYIERLEEEREQLIHRLIADENNISEMYSESEIGYLFSDNPERPKSLNMEYLERLTGKSWGELKNQPPQEKE